MLNKFKATDILFLLALNILVGTLVYANDTPIAEELKRASFKFSTNRSLLFL